MENSLVTFAVTASGIQAPLGGPMLICLLGSDSDAQSLTFLRGHADHVARVAQYSAPHGTLSAYRADILAAQASSEFTQFLWRYVGVQPEIEGLSG